MDERKRAQDDTEIKRDTAVRGSAVKLASNRQEWFGGRLRFTAACVGFAPLRGA